MIYDPAFIKFVPPGLAEKLICGVHVPRALVMIIPLKKISTPAVVAVAVTTVEDTCVIGSDPCAVAAVFAVLFDPRTCRFIVVTLAPPARAKAIAVVFVVVVPVVIK